MSALDQLKKRLYKPKEEFKDRERRDARINLDEPRGVPQDWARPEFKNPEDVAKLSSEALEQMKHKARVKNLIIFLIIFSAIVLAGAFLAYKYYIKGGGLGFLSSDNIDIQIESAESVNAGEKFYLPVVIKNNNKVSLENVSLIVEYPDSSEPVNKIDSEFLREKRNLGEIPANSELRQSFEAFIFGEENAEKNFKITMEYRLKDTSAIFEKTEQKKIVILKPAISISIDAPQESGLGKEINFKIDAISNSAAVLKNIALDAEFPEGFQFENSDPAPEQNTFRWKLGDLMGGEKKTISVRGKMPTKTFATEGVVKISSGVLNESGDISVYSKKSATIQIKKSFLDLALKINGKIENYIAQNGERINVEIDWQNNLPIGINNAVIEAKINEGESALDAPSLSITNGNYRSFDKTIVFDSTTFPKFSYIESGEKGKVKFEIKFKKNLDIKSEADKNFKAVFQVKFFTSHIPAEYSDSEITGESEISALLASDFQFAQRASYSTGHFKNTGPIPPKVGKETTYTIKWSLVNSLNDLRDIEISATIPNYIKWLNNTFSSSRIGDISYNAETREIKWKISNLKAGAGINSPAEEISFQLLLLPAEAHLGTSPVLISKAEASAKDTFTGAVLQNSQPVITTQILNDPVVGFGKGVVVK